MEKGMERVEPEVSTPESDQCLLLTEQFWNIYPHRNGFKISKQETLAAIRKHVSREDCSLLLQATKNFAESPDAKKGIGVKDPHRFIVCGRGKEKSHPWREWINPERTSAVNNIPEYKRQPA